MVGAGFGFPRDKNKVRKEVIDGERVWVNTNLIVITFGHVNLLMLNVNKSGVHSVLRSVINVQGEGRHGNLARTSHHALRWDRARIDWSEERLSHTAYRSSRIHRPARICISTVIDPFLTLLHKHATMNDPPKSNSSTLNLFIRCFVLRLLGTSKQDSYRRIAIVGKIDATKEEIGQPAVNEKIKSLAKPHGGKSREGKRKGASKA